MPELTITEGSDRLQVEAGGQPLFDYVHHPDTPQLESPKPYLHPLHTLGGELVSLFRPHDHVWHKGISLALPNVDTENFWGGPTYVRDKGYQQLPNNGTQRHDSFPQANAAGSAAQIEEKLSWITEAGEHWFDETRRLVATITAPDAWVLTFETELQSRREDPTVFGSPTTEGRELAGYGGVFWRGPRSFNRGRILASGGREGPELMGERADWLAYIGRHDGSGAYSTLIFIDRPQNLQHPTQWFVRDDPYACISPAPFFDTKYELPAGAALRLRYDVVIGTGAWDLDRITAAAAVQ